MRANKKLIKQTLDIANDLCYDDKCKQELHTATEDIMQWVRR